MFCNHCGRKLPENSRFCPECGALVDDQGTRKAYERQKNHWIPLGFSNRINDPAFAKYRRKSGIGVILAYLIFIPIAVAAGRVAASITGKTDYNYVGIACSAISVICMFSQWIKSSAEKQWDGVVIDKTVKSVYGNSRDTSSDEYITVFRDNRGKKHKHRDEMVYQYLQIGDKVRYHPKFMFPFEKYDKNQDGYLLCNNCRMQNDYSRDTCSHCGLPLLK